MNSAKEARGKYLLANALAAKSLQKNKKQSVQGTHEKPDALHQAFFNEIYPCGQVKYADDIKGRLYITSGVSRIFRE